MNILVSKTAPFPISKKRSKTLAEIRDELTHITDHQKLAVMGGVVFRIRRKKKLCGNIVPQ